MVVMLEEERRTALAAGIDWAWTIGVQRRRLLEHEDLAAASEKDRLLRTSTERERPYTNTDRQHSLTAPLAGSSREKKLGVFGLKQKLASLIHSVPPPLFNLESR